MDQDADGARVVLPMTPHLHRAAPPPRNIDRSKAIFDDEWQNLEAEQRRRTMLRLRRGKGPIFVHSETKMEVHIQTDGEIPKQKQPYAAAPPGAQVPGGDSRLFPVPPQSWVAPHPAAKAHSSVGDDVGVLF